MDKSKSGGGKKKNSGHDGWLLINYIRIFKDREFMGAKSIDLEVGAHEHTYKYLPRLK